MVNQIFLENAKFCKVPAKKKYMKSVMTWHIMLFYVMKLIVKSFKYHDNLSRDLGVYLSVIAFAW